MDTGNKTAAATGTRPCANPICVSGVVYDDDESRDCPVCLGSEVVYCGCGQGPALDGLSCCVVCAAECEACKSMASESAAV